MDHLFYSKNACKAFFTIEMMNNFVAKISYLIFSVCVSFFVIVHDLQRIFYLRNLQYNVSKKCNKNNHVFYVKYFPAQREPRRR